MTTTLTPAQAWERILEGNQRFAANASINEGQDLERRKAVALGQSPFAQVLGCSDSRVPAEVVLDAGLGDLFVVRTAGHVVDSAVLGSLEFGVSVLGVPLLLVIGHERCGAVKATVDASTSHELPPGYLRDVVEHVAPSVFRVQADSEVTVPAVVREHVRQTCLELPEKSVVLQRALDEGRMALIGAVYHLEDGDLHLVHVTGPVDAQLEPSDTVE